jgi:hypothetical protein
VPAYYIGGQNLQPVERSVFDKLAPGMSLQQLVALLGPGFQPIYEGIGLIYWSCEDGRALNYWPDYDARGNSRYWVDAHGQDQKHEIVGRLAQDLIAGIVIKGAKAVIVCTKDTRQAKAGKPRTYAVGDTFQKVQPLPRIDLRIKRLDAKGLLCDYWYQASPEGILRYSESGTIMIRPKENKAPN